MTLHHFMSFVSHTTCQLLYTTILLHFRPCTTYCWRFLEDDTPDQSWSYCHDNDDCWGRKGMCLASHIAFYLKAVFHCSLPFGFMLTSSAVHEVLYPSILDADWSIQFFFWNGPISIEYCEIRSCNVGEGLLYVNHWLQQMLQHGAWPIRELGVV